MVDSSPWQGLLGFRDGVASGGAPRGSTVAIRAVNADGPGPASGSVSIVAF